jgi:hypothetical protein
MQHLRRFRHYGPKTFATWAAITVAIMFLAGFALWSS